MALRDVTRIYSDKTVNIVVYPKPTVLRYSGESSIEENVDFSEIEPLVIEGVCVKAKKRDWLAILFWSDNFVYLSTIFESRLYYIYRLMEEYRRKYLSPTYLRSSTYAETVQKDKTVSELRK